MTRVRALWFPSRATSSSELPGWDFLRQLAGRLFSVGDGDADGAANARRRLADWPTR